MKKKKKRKSFLPKRIYYLKLLDNFSKSSAFSICEWVVHCAYLEFKIKAVLPADVEFGCRQDISHLRSFAFWFYNARQPSSVLAQMSDRRRAYITLKFQE